MVLHLAEVLHVPLRKRNRLLLAAGYAPVYEERPPVAHDRGAGLLMEGLPEELLAPPLNVLRASLHPDGLAPRIGNLGQWKAHVMTRLAARSR